MTILHPLEQHSHTTVGPCPLTVLLQNMYSFHSHVLIWSAPMMTTMLPMLILATAVRNTLRSVPLAISLHIHTVPSTPPHPMFSFANSSSIRNMLTMLVSTIRNPISASRIPTSMPFLIEIPATMTELDCMPDLNSHLLVARTINLSASRR